MVGETKTIQIDFFEFASMAISKIEISCRLKYSRLHGLERYTPGQRERSPDYQKLRVRVTHIWGNRKGQPNRSAMEGPHPGGTALRITVAPTPGKYGCWLLADRS